MADLALQEMLGLMLKSTTKSVMDDIDEHRENICKTGEQSVAMRDAYGNSLMAIGTDDKVESFTNYGLSNDTLNWPLWLALYNDSWVFRRAIDKPATDEIRCGITIQGDADYTEIYKELKKYRNDLIQLLKWGALFGGSIACLMFDNLQDEDYAKPMDFGKIKKSKAMRMYVTDRWYGVTSSTDTVTNMQSIDFGKPVSYTVTLADGKSITFHHDYVLRYEHRGAPKLIKNGMLQGWGYAEGSHILNELSRDDKLKASIQSLVDKSLIEVIKMAGMRGVFMGADKDNEQQLRKRLEMVNWGRTFNSLTFLDKEDDYQQNQFSGLGGLADILENNLWLVSAALEMQGILFGDLKQGFSNDTDAMARYDETINNRCEDLVRPVMTKFLGILFRKFNINEKVEFDFNSLIVDTQENKMMERLEHFVDLSDKLLNSGVIDTQQYAIALKQYLNNKSINYDLTDEKIEALKNTMQEEFEGINLNEVE